MTRQAATTCAAAVARALEARGLPGIYRSPLPQAGFLLSKGARRVETCWREAALRPVSPHRASSCQSRVVLGLGRRELRSILPAGQRPSTFTPTYRFFSFFISKLNTTTRYITQPPQLPHSLLANLPWPPALPLCAQATPTLSRHSPIDVCTKDRRIAPSAFSSSVATRTTWTSFLSLGAISIRQSSQHNRPSTTTSQWLSNPTPRSPSPTSSQMTPTSTAENAAVLCPCVSSHWVLVALALLVSSKIAYPLLPTTRD